MRYEQIGIFQRLAFAHAADVANAAIEEFTSGRASSVHLVYNEFKSVMSQRIVVEQLLPIPRLEGEAKDTGPTIDYLYEPAPEEIFRDLLPRHVQMQVYRALLESNAAFLRRADDGDGRGNAQLGRDDREPDALHEQGPAGGHHARNHRSRVGSRSDVTCGGLKASGYR